jgi:putative SOS response-associated peptidase YedK
MCNLYSITTNQAAIIAMFRVVNRYVGNLAPMPGVFPDYKAPIVRNGTEGSEFATARWGMPSSQHATASDGARRRHDQHPQRGSTLTALFSGTQPHSSKSFARTSKLNF